MKITSIKLRRLRVIEDVGVLDLAWSPGDQLPVQIGGGAFVEISTDEGLTGIGPEDSLISLRSSTPSPSVSGFEGSVPAVTSSPS